MRRALIAVALWVGAVPSLAQSGPPPNYVAGFLGTTLAYCPNGGSFQGWQHDVTPLLGYGRFVSSSVALELDAGPTFVRGDYASFALVPGLVWTFSSKAYLAARFIVPVDPQANFTLFPGIGLSRTFKNRYTPILELNLSSTVGRGKPDFGVALTAGLLVAF